MQVLVYQKVLLGAPLMQLVAGIAFCIMHASMPASSAAGLQSRCIRGQLCMQAPNYSNLSMLSAGAMAEELR